MELFALTAAGVFTFRLARKLSGDPYAASLAAVIFIFSPVVRVLIAAHPRPAAAAVLLPFLLLRFYRLTDLERDGDPHRRRVVIFLAAASLAFAGVLYPGFAVAANFLLWLVLLIGYLMDRRRRWDIWGAPILGWFWASAVSILLYLPVWWWRRLHPGALGGALSSLSINGADFIDLWQPSPYYAGMGVCVMALAGLNLTRSYRQQARLWFLVSGFMMWLSLGSRFMLGGRYIWWVPALNRGLSKIPLYTDVEPIFYAASAQLALGLLSAYGFAALLTRVPPLKVRWVRPLLTALLAFLIIGDLLRVQPLFPFP